ncbi:MAG: hypothetical protein ACD_2C00130G0007 [uncultured bacterium (gcode 4)]|uniref:Uncharacterized protein n=1 Tax=uncultured bacterium (gcode 4) TaxID=1234023 RepID=K2FEQ1_9BACT|nr:MAG: hypothetical protein ACD_2C00130G0007 [uncultured bacterium (gcode 4)]
MKSKKIITWIAVIAIILSFLAPLLTFFFESPADNQTTSQSSN